MYCAIYFRWDFHCQTFVKSRLKCEENKVEFFFCFFFGEFLAAARNNEFLISKL